MICKLKYHARETRSNSNKFNGLDKLISFAENLLLGEKVAQVGQDNSPTLFQARSHKKYPIQWSDWDLGVEGYRQGSKIHEIHPRTKYFAPQKYLILA